MIQPLRQSAPSLSPSNLPDPVRAVIFDMDGTLIDTEAAHRRAFAETGEAIGWPMSDALLLSNGMGLQAVLEALLLSNGMVLPI